MLSEPLEGRGERKEAESSSFYPRQKHPPGPVASDSACFLSFRSVFAAGHLTPQASHPPQAQGDKSRAGVSLILEQNQTHPFTYGF